MAEATEQVRLQDLQALAVLDSPPEERFDRVVGLARHVFRVPTAAMSFLGGGRHWVKAHVGLEGGPIQRAHAFCEATIDRAGTLVVPDAPSDHRFATDPAVTSDQPIRFYAGHPVRSPAGLIVGVLYVIDRVPRDLDREQVAVLVELAGWVESELARRDELARAEWVQHGLLPAHPPSIPGYSVAGCCITASEVGGDFFDWFPVGDAFQFTIADVMGKGLGAGIIAATVRAVLRTTFRVPARPSGDLERRRTLLVDAVTNAARGMEFDLQETSSFVTLFTARLDVATGVLSYVDAGHGLTVLVGTNGVPYRLASDDLPIGVIPDGTWSENQVEMEPGDTLISVSDGALTFFSNPIEVLDAAAILARGSDSAQQVVDEIARFARARRVTDDVAALVIRRDLT